MKKGREKWRKVRRRLGWLLLLAALAGFTFSQWNNIEIPLRYTLSSTASVHYGDAGQLWLIDQGKTAVELLGANGKLERHWTGTSLNKFYFAEQAAAGPDGAVYVADRAYRTQENGATVMVERILEFQDQERRIAWEVQAAESNVSQKSSILELQYWQGNVWFLREENRSLALYVFAPGEQAILKQRFFVGETVNDASYDLSTSTLVVTTRRGFVRCIRDGENSWTTVPSPEKHMMPSSVSARAGWAFVADAYGSQICRLSLDRPEDGLSTYWQEGVHVINLEASEDGMEVLASDGAGFYRIREIGWTYVDEVEYAQFPATLLAWVALALAACMALWAMRGLLPLVRNILRKESSLRVIIVALVAVTVSIFVAYSLMTELFQQEDDTTVDNMKLFAEIMRDGIDTDALREVAWEQDYGGASYNRVRGPMDTLLRLAYQEKKEYYYVLYRLDGDVLRLIMNSDDYVMCGEPYDMGDQDYSAEVQRTGTAYSLRTRDADGDWINVMIPVTDKSGIRFAVLEVGMDMALRTRQRQESAFNIVLTVMCTTAVVVMLILEGVFLLSFQERKRAMGALAAPGPETVPVRTLMCLSYVADSMQEPFIAVLCVDLYRGGLRLPDSVAAALPLSGELLVMAVFSAVAGPLVQKWGTRRLMSGGMTVQLVGSVICFLVGNYAGIFIGKLLIGAGMGMIYVTCNTVASAGKTEESIGEAFAGISAGILSGMSIGAGMASLFLSIGGWRTIYAVGALLMGAGLALSLSAPDVWLHAAKETETQHISLPRFLFNWRVILFFLFLLVPFMMSLSYREYFFPIFAQEHGLNEVRIGQIYLLCGLLVLYLGPSLTAWMLRTMGALWSMVAGSALMCVNMLIFVIYPSLVSVFIGVALVYAVFSFSSGCQYTFFQSLPECGLFGEGKSLGVYSVFESTGQTLGPVAYGALLAMGAQRGIGMFCAAMTALLVLYVAVMWRTRKNYR